MIRGIRGIVYKHNYKQGLSECDSDTNFGGLKETGKSTSGIVILYSGGAISGFRKKQTVVATSTTEAKTIVVNKCSREIISPIRLFCDTIRIPVLQVDNTVAIKLTQNQEFHRHIKHICIKHFFTREKILEKELLL